MPFVKYNKIYRIGTEETEGILNGKCYIEEKVDGANTQIWFEDGFIRVGSRSQQITEGFNGFVGYVMTNEPIKKIFADHPDWKLYGEWLVRHTIHYRETSYKQFYLFDIVLGDGKLMPTYQVKEVAQGYGINTPQLFATIENPTLEQIDQYVGKTCLGEKGEGVVIKNPSFVNKFGEYQHAKIVTQEFKEDNGLVFGGNNKHSETYWEMYVVNKYMTLERVQKIMNKLQPVIDKKLDLEHIPRIMHTAYHDMLTEEVWEISKKAQSINFKDLQRLSQRKAAQIYKDLLLGSVSVADRKN